MDCGKNLFDCILLRADLIQAWMVYIAYCDFDAFTTDSTLKFADTPKKARLEEWIKFQIPDINLGSELLALIED